MSKLRIHVLGALRVQSQAQDAVTIPARKAQGLLAYLAMQPGRPQPRPRLAALLWGDSGEAQARASLRQCLLVLRKALALSDGDLIAGPGDAIALSPSCAAVDALEFERLVDDGRPEALERAAELYAGEFLEALETRASAFDDWLAARRQQLRERAMDAMARLLAHHAAASRHDHAIAVALRLLALDPLQEPVHRTLMQLYAAQGRQASALRQFLICRDVLARELGVAPQPQTMRLREEIERQRQAPPPGRAAPARDGAELRQVVMLVAEPGGTGDLFDLEQARALGDRFVEAATGTVARFGGTLERRLGAGVAAVFGVPVGHGDDAERAARCALQLRETAPDLQIGLAAGTMLVTPADGASGRPDSIVGDAASIAARLAAGARPGEILVSDPAWQLLSDRAEGDRSLVRASSAAQRRTGAWRLAGLRTGDPGSGALVGRRNELAQFASVLQACRDHGTGLMMHLRGEPGIGKTRLVEEFRRRAAAHGFACHRAAVLDFGSSRERDPVRALVRDLLGAGTREGDREVVERALADGLMERAHEMYLHHLLHLPQPGPLKPVFDEMDGAARERGMREALACLLRGCSARQPRLVVLEDLHWASARTLSLVEALAGAARDGPVLLVTTARGEGDPLSATWRARVGAGGLVTIDLGPLRWAEASALAAQTVEVADDFTIRCVERSGGNPLFLEQLLRAGRSGRSELPASIQSVVLARLDRLARDERDALRFASVLGQRFPLAALGHLLGASHGWDPDLAQGLLHVEDDEGVFAHALVRESAYASLPPTRRRDLHARAAAWFAGRDAVLHAEHLARAEEPAAAQAFLDAACVEAGLRRPEHALQLAERGLALAGDGPTRFELACCRAELLRDEGETQEAQRAFDAALQAASNDAQCCRAWLGMAAVLGVRDDLDAAAAALVQAERAAGAGLLHEPLARVHFMRGNLLFPRGDIDGCLREHRRSLELAQACGSPQLQAMALGGLGDAEFMRGRMLSARDHFVACLDLARRHGFKRVEAANLPMVAITRWYGGDTRAALAEALAAIAAAARIGHHRAEAIAQHAAFQCRHALGQHVQALEHAERALALSMLIDAPRLQAEALAFRAEARSALGQPGLALPDLHEALAIARRTGMDYMGPVFLGLLALVGGDGAVRGDALAEGEALLRANRVAHNHLLFRRSAIDACLAAHDWPGALRHAAALEARAREQPLPWCDYFVSRARILAAWGAGGRDAALRAQLHDARALGLRQGLLEANKALDAAANA